VPRSPCLKLKPVSKGDKPGFQMLAVETYGGGLWHTWFDRDLSVAGRVLLRKGERLVHRLARPPTTWPALYFCCRVVQQHAVQGCCPAALPCAQPLRLLSNIHTKAEQHTL